jgi:hypothetical protein
VLHQRYGVIFGVSTYFFCQWLWFIVCGFIELLGLADAFFVIYEIFGCLCLDAGH